MVQQVGGPEKPLKHGATEGCAINHRRLRLKLLLQLQHTVEFLIRDNQSLSFFFLVILTVLQFSSAACCCQTKGAKVFPRGGEAGNRIRSLK